jgi:hypothetical protein
MVVIPNGAEVAKVAPDKERTSGNIRRLEYDHRYKSTSSALLRADHTKPCTGVVQIPIGLSSEILGSRLVGDRDPGNKWVGKGGLRRAGCTVRRKVEVMFLVSLQRNVKDIYLRNMDRYALEHLVVLVRGHLEHALHPGIHMRGSIAQVSLIKGGPM